MRAKSITVISEEDSFDEDQPRTYITKHGTQVVMKTANIAGKKAVPSVPADSNQESPDDFDANAEFVVAREENQTFSYRARVLYLTTDAVRL